MFYPVDSLKRGGRFYLCWVADSWPLRFAAITHRQLWSQDIRKLCVDLLEVMTNESGRATNRFSLRLSSQLMRGLVRLYERKVTVFLGDLCMINAHVFKSANKKWAIHEMVIVGHVERPLQLPQLPATTIPEEPENEPRVEEMIQNSGNVVGNIQDITLKESAIPDFQLPPNDGFGEEHPEQALQLLGDRTVEMMLLQPDASGVQHSILDLPLDTTDKSHDKSRLAPHEPPQMERISEHDVTLFRKSAQEEILAVGEFEKDMPEIPDIPPPAPELPVPPPQLEKQVTEQPEPGMPVLEPEIPKDAPEPSLTKDKEPVDIELEDLEAQPQGKKRRTKNKLIIDKKIKISAGFLRARIDNNAVELRCEDSSDDIINIRVPWDMLSRRPAHAGTRLYSNVADVMTRLFQQNCAVMDSPPLAEREAEAVEEPRQRRRKSTLEKIIEEDPQQIQIDPQVQFQAPAPAPVEQPIEVEVSRDVLNATIASEQRASVLEPMDIQRVIQEPMDICDLPTQKLETLSQARKRTSEYEISPKRPRMSGYVTFRDSQSQQGKEENQQLSAVIIDEPGKENIPPELEQQPSHPVRQVRDVSTMLQEAGIADVMPVPPVLETDETRSKEDSNKRGKGGSESSETPLGSLDRTKVSLGDSVNTTDSQRFIRNQWGIEGTMVKILSGIKAGMRPVTVENLIAKGPVMSGYKSIIAARCFTSILKLKQHKFVNIVKDPDTLEIRDITLGSMFDGLE